MNDPTTPAGLDADDLERRLRRRMVRVGRALHRAGLVAATDGNLSCRIDRDRVLVTPTGIAKGRMRPVDLVITDLRGKVLHGDRAPSAEQRMHLAVYNARPETGAVVHAHPPVATALTVAGLSWLLERPVIPEVVATFGRIPTLPYATPTSAEVPGDVAEAVRDHVGMILDRHGAVTLGPDLWTAFHRMEKLEHAAGILAAAWQLGEVRELTADQLRRLRDAR